MHLALANWVGIGAVKMCVQPWAVSSQHSNDVPFAILCPRPDTTGTKALLNTLLEQRAFLKRIGPTCLEQTGQDIARPTGHPICCRLLQMGSIHLFLRIY